MTTSACTLSAVKALLKPTADASFTVVLDDEKASDHCVDILSTYSALSCTGSASESNSIFGKARTVAGVVVQFQRE